jgi:hypothetical protein
MPGLARPLDFGVRFRGEPLLGKNKTFRGPVVMAAASALSAWALASVSQPSQLPPGFDFLSRPGPAFRFGLLAGLGYALAELPNSFVKRRLRIQPGDRPAGLGGVTAYAVDQADSVAGIVLLMRLVYSTPNRILASIFVWGTLVHIVIDMSLYWFGVKTLNKAHRR